MWIDATWPVYCANHILSVLNKFSQQLLGAARGLQFLHENLIVHGALQPVCETLLSWLALNKASRA